MDINGRMNGIEVQEFPPHLDPAELEAKVLEQIFNIVDSEELDDGDFEVAYCIDGILADCQPMIIAAPSKKLKTTIGIDMAIAIASGGLFLDRYETLISKRVLVMSAESGMATLKAKAKANCRTRGIALKSLKDQLLWCDTVPQLADIRHLAALENLFKRMQIDAVILDPTYLCISGENMSNLSDQGAQLRAFAMLCQRLAVTLILIHHTKKTIVHNDPLELADIQGAGFGEFCRQWLLINGRDKFDPETGSHKLWINYGGSAGHCGLIGCDISEGVYRPDAAWRKWEVTIGSPDEVRRDMARQSAAAKQSARQAKATADQEKTLEAFQKAFRSNQNAWLTASGLETLSAIGRKTIPFRETLAEGIRTGKIEQQELKATNNKMEIHYRAVWEDQETVDSGRLQRFQCQENLPLSTAEDGPIKKGPSSTAATSVEGKSSTVKKKRKPKSKQSNDKPAGQDDQRGNGRGGGESSA